MNNTATREELKAILDEWIPKYIRQVVELRSGSRLSAERYNELMNLLITQGDDTIELAETVKQYVEILVEELNTTFTETTELVTALSNNAVNTANEAVSTVTEYKATINADIAAFKDAVNKVTADATANADLAVQTANQVVSDMEAYRVALDTYIEQTFNVIRNTLGTQVTEEVARQTNGIQEALSADLNASIAALTSEVMTIANTAEQAVNSAIQDIEAYKTGMDARLDEALREVEESLSVAGEVIQDAAAIYSAISDMQNMVDGFEERLEAVEQFVDNADFADAGHKHTKSEITDFPTSMPPSAHTHSASEITGLPSSLPPTAHKHSKSEITDFPTSLPASDVPDWAKQDSKPTYKWSEITEKPTSFAPTSHNQAASTVTAGTFAGKVQANATAMATLANAQVRDIYAGTSDMTAGSSSLTTGTIYAVYE